MFNLKQVISSQEGKILALGVLLLFGYLLAIVGVYLFSVDDANKLLGISVANFFFGRAAGISFGFTAGFSDLTIIVLNIILEFILVLIIYPLFVLSWNKSIDIDCCKNFFMAIEKQRHKYKSFFDTYGKYGLFIFVWFPFWMTGPIVGAIIGFLIGINHYRTIIIVLSGTSLAIVIWTYFLKEIIDLLNQLTANAGYVILALFVLITLGLKIIKSFNKKSTK